MLSALSWIIWNPKVIKSKCNEGENIEGGGLVSGTKNARSSPGKGVRGGTSAATIGFH